MNRRQFGAGLLGTAGAIGLDRLALAMAPPRRLNATGPTSVKFTFAGLLVFHPMNDIFELGILRARGLASVSDHIFRINIVPDPNSGEKPRQLNDVLEGYVQDGDVIWSLDVQNNIGNADIGVQATLQEPANRHQSNQRPKDLGWMVNVESRKFHSRRLTRLPNKLKPIITLNYGQLNTACKTESVDVYKGGNIKYDNFGFIAGATELSIDTSHGEKVVLKTQKQADILGLTPGVSYDIEVLNAPIPPNPARDPNQVPPEEHFHLYYALLFSGVGDSNRFSFMSHPKPEIPDDHCDPVVHKFDPARMFEPDPYKCGGITLNPGGDALG